MKIVFDPKLKRPGCVLLQVALGGEVPSELFSRLFPAETWLVYPTPGMGVFEASGEQLELLSHMAITSSSSKCSEDNG